MNRRGILFIAIPTFIFIMFMFIFSFPNYLYSEKPFIMDFPQAGTFKITGEIKSKEWKRVKEFGYWYGSLSNFAISPKWKENKEFQPAFKKSFIFDKKNKNFVVKIKGGGRKNQKKHSLLIVLSGISHDKRPGNLKFRKKEKIDLSQPKKVPLKSDDFTLGDKKPTGLEFKIENEKPKIILSFKESSEKSQSLITGTEESETDILLTSWGKNLPVFLIDDSGVIRKILNWNDPKRSFSIPPGNNFNYTVLIITPFGRCRCDKKDKISIKEDFIRELKVKTNVEDALVRLSYSNDIERDVPFSSAKTDQKGEAIIYLPKHYRDDYTLWRIEARKKGYLEVVEEKLENLNKFRKDFIELQLLQKVITIKTEPEAIVTVMIDKLILDTKKTNERGETQILYIDGYDIIIEKEGFRKKVLRRFETSLNEKKIKLNPIKTQLLEKPEFNKESLYTNQGIDHLDLKIKLYSFNQKPLFNGLIKDLYYLPLNAKTYELEDSRGIVCFQGEKTIIRNKIDLTPYGKRADVNLRLESITGKLLSKRQSVNIYYYSQENQDSYYYSMLEDNYYSKEICLPYNKGRLKKLDLFICYPGYESKEIELTPLSSFKEKLIIKKTIQLKNFLPEVMLVISGNEKETGDYYLKAKRAVIELWNKYIDRERVTVGVTNNGNFIPMETKEKLDNITPNSQGTNREFLAEINKAKSQFKNVTDFCGRNRQKRLVYISRFHESTELYQNITDETQLYIISDCKYHSQSGPRKIYKNNWYESSEKEEIKSALIKILEGN